MVNKDHVIYCNYCDGRLADEVDWSGDEWHDTCGAEFDYRLANKICGMCGKNPAEDGELWCEQCDAGPVDYQGFPG